MFISLYLERKISLKSPLNRICLNKQVENKRKEKPLIALFRELESTFQTSLQEDK